MDVVTKFIGIEVGELFHSVNKLQEAIQNVQDSTFVELYVRNSQKILSMRKKIPAIVSTAEKLQTTDVLKYYEIVYCCKFGGRNFVSKRKDEKRASK